MPAKDAIAPVERQMVHEQVKKLALFAADWQEADIPQALPSRGDLLLCTRNYNVRRCSQVARKREQNGACLPFVRRG
jgi:hypothetical protein